MTESKGTSGPTRLAAAAAALSMLALATGCGQSGPLFLPGDEQAVTNSTDEPGNSADDEDDDE